MDKSKELAKQRVSKSFKPGIFESLPEEVKESLINKELELAELKPLAEKERERQAYQDQKKREAATTHRQLLEFGVAERVGYDWTPRKMNGVEEGCLDVTCEFEVNEPNPKYHFKDGRVIGFSRETIEKLWVPQMQDIWDRANAHEDVQRSATGYMLFHLWTGNMHRDGTKATSITDNWKEDLDNLFKAETELVDNIKKGEASYSHIYESDSPCYMHLYFRANYYPEPKSVNNWGTGIKPIEKRRTFDIFTASDLDVPCATQVAKRLWGDDTNESDLDSIIKRAGDKICIVKPHSTVRTLKDINDYSDLVVEARSPIKSLSVINNECIYLLHFNEHVGLLENVKMQNRNQYYTSFRPVQKYPKTKKITMCFDIECYFDPDKDQRHVPYLCCACFVYDDNVGNVVEFEGRDCVAQMIEYAVRNVSDFGLNSIELIAHNGGGYDFHYILSSMYDPSVVYDILIRNNHFISFKFKHMGVKFSVKDSLNFLLCSLSNAAKAFLCSGSTDTPTSLSDAACSSREVSNQSSSEATAGLLAKTDFPHHEVRSADDLQRTFNKWISVDKAVNIRIEKEKMIVNSEHHITYKENEESRKLIDWAKEYCCNDVIVLANVWVKFKQTVVDIFNCHIVDQTYTLAGLSFRLFEAHLPPKIRLYHPTKTDFVNMRESLIGGRCISLNGMYRNVVCVDVKSLYPTAMAYYEQPYGYYRKVTKEITNELGIYYCEVSPATFTSYSTCVCSTDTRCFACKTKSSRESKSEKYGFFPLRTSDGSVTYRLGSDSPSTPASSPSTGKASSKPYGVYRGWYTSVDMQIGRSEGHLIKPIQFDESYVGYSWKNKGKIFKDYIENVLYKLKIKYEEAGDKEKRQVIKIIMNSLWGKFAQKWMDTQYKIKDETACDMDVEECYKIWDTEWFMVKSKQKNKVIASKPVQNGVFVLSWARWHMKLLWEAIAKTDANMIYSDTDSMMVERKMIDQNSKITIDDKQMSVVGDEMGQLEVEAVFDQLVCVGKKQYIGSYRCDSKAGGTPLVKYKKRFKGVPMEYIRPEMYTHLLESPDNKVQIDFLKFKREWGAVHGYIESKVVTQT